jgi:eukaryotic-like serine/threonine-protein kinase
MTQCVKKEFGRYEILGAIHRGGMGEILLVRVRGSQGFSRKLVLKGVLPELMDDAISTHLFRREARLMASLEHPNIVQVFDVPEIEGVPYLAMEYVRGRNVHQLIQQSSLAGERIPLRIACHIVAELLRGLHYAHRAKDESGKHIGIVHRDISPGNILLSYFGEVKVTDFGIAKVADTPKITGPRSIRGKARYTSPETIRRGECTPLSDVYAAGVVLSEILIGRPLFDGKNLSQTLLQIVSEPRDALLRRIIADGLTPKKLRPLLAKALALEPKQRFRSAIEFADALDELCRAEGGPVTASELGAFIRDIFLDAEDVPQEENLSAKTPCGWRDRAKRKKKTLPSKDTYARRQQTPSRVGSRPPPPPPIGNDTEDLPCLAYPASAVTADGISEIDAVQSPVFASYLIENILAKTDEEVAQSPADSGPRRGLSAIEARIWDQPLWLLIAVGLALGAGTAFAGAMLGMLTAIR